MDPGVVLLVYPIEARGRSGESRGVGVSGSELSLNAGAPLSALTPPSVCICLSVAFWLRFMPVRFCFCPFV